MSAGRRRPISGGTVVITGAGSGIGRALAQRLSRAGSPAALCDIDADGLKTTAASLPGPTLTQVVDVRDGTAVQAFAAQVRAWSPTALSAVFNNAGVAVTASVLNSVPADEDWLHQINFGGVMNGTRAFLPILVEQDSGVIANTSSVYGLLGVPYQSAYCASKFAVRGFTDALRQELRGTGVRAVNIHPGGITTNIARNARFSGDPEGRGRTHEEIAAEFEAMTLTSPEKAAKIIHTGIDRGKPRILVGPDARVFDLLARLAPARYYSVIAAMESRLPTRPASARTGSGR
jgi:NADP-dependent 3-hydroxy acid dehydrogenase YdfG